MLRKGAPRSFPVNKTHCYTERSEVSQTNFLNCHTTTFCHTEGVARSISTKGNRDISVSTKPQYDKVGGLNTISSPSLAEGLRGWVNSTSASQAKSATANHKNATASNANANASVITKETSASPCFASERSERGNPQETLAQRIDCHANASAFARNDEKSAHNAKSTLNDERLTHPQTPPQGRGLLSSPRTKW